MSLLHHSNIYGKLAIAPRFLSFVYLMYKTAYELYSAK